MILYCNFEEVTALNHGARAFLDDGPVGESAVAAPTESRSAVEALIPRLDGDVSIVTLEEQKRVQLALELIVEHLRMDLEMRVVASHAADETAVAAYFGFAHALSVLGRVREMGEEMMAMIEVMTGQLPTPRMEREFRFPD